MTHVPDDSLPLDPGSPFFLDHVSRYWWALDLARGLDVLDCACGTGYGSYILSKRARSVLGVDLNQPALDAASTIFAAPNLRYERLDVLELARSDRKFDLITAFEVLEHIEPETTDAFLGALKAALRPGGKLLLSTPNHDVVLKSGVSVPHYHINNLRPAELRRRLGEHFASVRMLGQFRRRSGLGALVFDLDYLNLRHALGAWLRPRPASASATAGSAPTAQRTRAEIRALYDAPPAGAADYRFSPRHWRQAGMSFAVCSVT